MIVNAMLNFLTDTMHSKSQTQLNKLLRQSSTASEDSYRIKAKGRQKIQLDNDKRSGSVPILTEGESAPSKNSRRLVVLGSSKVGKTAIVSRFLHNKFDESYTPTIEDFHRKVYRIKGEAYRLDMLDTSGNHPFPAMRRLSLVTGDLFILVFSMDCRETFEEVRRLCDQIYETKGQSATGKKRVVPIIIVGNKCDKEEREIGSDEVTELTDKMPGSAYIETSAKLNLNVDEVFQKLFQLAKLPTEMSPSQHRKVQPTYIGTGSPGGSFRRGMTIRRRLSDACGALAPNARRPSIRTDLLILQHRRHHSESDSDGPRDNPKCVIQ